MRIISAHSKSQEGFTFGLPMLLGVHFDDMALFVSEVATSNKAKGKATYWRMRTVTSCLCCCLQLSQFIFTSCCINLVNALNSMSSYGITSEWTQQYFRMKCQKKDP
jgi:hypothetical protein